MSDENKYKMNRVDRVVRYMEGRCCRCGWKEDERGLLVVWPGYGDEKTKVGTNFIKNNSLRKSLDKLSGWRLLCGTCLQLLKRGAWGWKE